jgi:hypothetical protein
VLDIPQPDAAVCGNALMLSRGVLESEDLPAVLAHELGHLATSDGRLTAALNRLVIFSSPLGPTAEETREQPRERPPDAEHPREPREGEDPVWFWTKQVARVLAKIAVFAKGGLGLRIAGPTLGRYWRGREYKADQYAASLGQADELADFLEVHALIHDHPVHLAYRTHASTNRATHQSTTTSCPHPGPSHYDAAQRTAARAAADHSTMTTLARNPGDAFAYRFVEPRRRSPQPAALIAPGTEPVKAAPAGPPTAGPDGPTLTEPDPSAEQSHRSAGKALPTRELPVTMESSCVV